MPLFTGDVLSAAQEIWKVIAMEYLYQRDSIYEK